MDKREEGVQAKYDAKTIKKMNRRGLLEVLVAQGKRIEELEASNAALKEDLDRANRRLDNFGINREDISAISKASSKIDCFFQVAQDAMEEYISKAGTDQVSDMARLYEKAKAEYLRMTETGKEETRENEEA